MYIRILICLVFSSITTLSAQEWEQVWADEFNGDTLNEDHWSFELGNGCPDLCGWGNNELQIYTSTNHRLEGGKLYITAKKEDGRYTSTKITTQKKQTFQYGKFEIRAKLATGQGLWPAFWLLGENINTAKWPSCGEIDVLEYVGRAPGEIFTSLHTLSNHGDYAHTKTTTIPNIEEGFHLYTADWNEDSIRFFVDNKLVYQFAPKEKNMAIWPFNQPFYLLLNLAVGGNFGGEITEESVFPQEFVIDYIRVFQQAK